MDPVIVLFGFGVLAIGALFAMQIGIHRRARSRDRARQATAEASLWPS